MHPFHSSSVSKKKLIPPRSRGANNFEGDCDDEGTLFSVASYNLTTNKEALAYIQSNYLLGSTDAEIATLALHCISECLIKPKELY